MDTTITQVEWMDREATTNDNDAIDTDMHARAGDGELMPWLLVLDCAPQFFFGAKRDVVTLVVCHRIRYGLLAASRADSWLLSLDLR